MTFAQAAERHLDDVYGYLAWFTSDRAVAEDLTGETFERALRLWHRFDPKRGQSRRARSNVSPVRSSAASRSPVNQAR